MNALSDYQKAVLTELGIPLWQRRHPRSSEQVEQPTATENDATTESISEVDLPAEPAEERVDDAHPMAIDVLQHLGAMTGMEVERWVVSSRLRLDGGVLYAPHPMYLASQPDTKRQLWKLLSG